MPRSGIMLCYPFEEKRLEKWKPPYLIQPKLDGERCRALMAEHPEYILGKSTLLSSEENLFNFAVPHIEEAYTKLCRSEGIARELDGELYSHELYLEGGFDLIQSIVSRTVNIHPRFEEMEYWIFDYVSDEPQYKRWQTLDKMKHYLKPPLRIIPTYGASCLEDVMQMYDYILSQGYEGIIVRHIDAPYRRKRSTYMMKFKPKKDDYYRIVGYKEEVDKNGKPKGRLGSLVCQGDDTTSFSVGSGLTGDLRESLWRNKETLIGDLCHVQYQNITSGKGVPRFPIFVEIVESEPEIENPLLEV